MEVHQETEESMKGLYGARILVSDPYFILKWQDCKLSGWDNVHFAMNVCVCVPAHVWLSAEYQTTLLVLSATTGMKKSLHLLLKA